MRNRWHLWNEPTLQFSKVPCFKNISSWKPPNGYPALKLFLSEAEKGLFEYQRNSRHTLT